MLIQFNSCQKQAALGSSGSAVLLPKFGYAEFTWGPIRIRINEYPAQGH